MTVSETRFQLVDVAHRDSAEACTAAGLASAITTSVDTARMNADANPGLYRVVAEYIR